jgi:hypothetical protein
VVDDYFQHFFFSVRVTACTNERSTRKWETSLVDLLSPWPNLELSLQGCTLSSFNAILMTIIVHDSSSLRPSVHCFVVDSLIRVIVGASSGTREALSIPRPVWPCQYVSTALSDRHARASVPDDAVGPMMLRSTISSSSSGLPWHGVHDKNKAGQRRRKGTVDRPVKLYRYSPATSAQPVQLVSSSRQDMTMKPVVTERCTCLVCCTRIYNQNLVQDACRLC